MRRRLLGLTVAAVGPGVVTIALLPLGQVSRDYVFIYLGLVAVLAVLSGMAPAMLAAAVSFLLVDYFFVAPVHQLSIADGTDLINLVVFFGAAGLVGGLGSRRRRAQLRAQALSAALGRANEDLERLNREQAEAAATAVRLARTEQQVHALEETDRLRADLLANVSHELRTPLATMLTGSTDLLNDGELTTSARERVAGIVSETQRLSRLVSDMLDLARIEGRAVRLDPVEIDLGEAFAAAVERLHRTSPTRAVEVEVTGALEVTADWGRLGQILDNLLANADRYSPASRPVRIEAAAGKRAMVVVRIVDEGPGIERDQRERIFERFVRADPSAVGVDGAGGGTGLGLAIVRGLVEAHAGRVWVEEPGPGEGTRLAFALPAAVASGGDGEDVDVHRGE